MEVPAADPYTLQSHAFSLKISLGTERAITFLCTTTPPPPLPWKERDYLVHPYAPTLNPKP